MIKSEETNPKAHYICQTYVEKTVGREKQASLQIGKKFQYSTASQVQERAGRERRSDKCVGADASMVSAHSRLGWEQPISKCEG